ncbi:uncharacterized protein LOC122576654 [Bombus pyrosoma]|uniref:uncharacterized protein LOC122576654 n=1 Tax=Bombus pyrosoma TaxID=396416 RepID=UPI001CB96BBC|nr:uncharacterized protein LOC122576654 [Bombus pyrosoma]
MFGNQSCSYQVGDTNFVGANKELKELRILLQSGDHKERVQIFLADWQIQCRFNAPNSPHFGGLWEAAVKGTELLTFEHLNTFVIEIETILNCRPLTQISSDSNDLPVLTPGHFLIGDTLSNLRERDFRATPPTNPLSSFKIHTHTELSSVIALEWKFLQAHSFEVALLAKMKLTERHKVLFKGLRYERV